MTVSPVKRNVCPMTGQSGITCPSLSNDNTNSNNNNNDDDNGVNQEKVEVMSPQEQQERIWKSLCQHNYNNNNNESKERSWPSYDTVMSDVAFSDYSKILSCPLDVHMGPNNHTKTLCPFGAVACIEMEVFENTPYTGLLSPGQTLSHGIIRLSSAIQPLVTKQKPKNPLLKPILVAAGKELAGAKLFPTVAMKFFRHNGIRSGNLLFAGRKVGQSELDFFAHCVCTQLTEKVATTLKPIVKIFSKYAKSPLSLGVSDFCSHDVHGNQQENIVFPFVITLKPLIQFPHSNYQNEKDDRPFDWFLNDLETIPEGTAIYDLYACPNPMAVEDATQLQRIGQIRTSSKMILSGPTDSLFFRHQRKEEDYQHQPQWKAQVKKHHINNKAGWKIFEKHIATGTYQDFEKATTTSSSIS